MKKVRRRSGKAGLPPGTIITVDDEDIGEHAAHLFTYNKDSLVESALTSLKDFALPDPGHSTTWINIAGLSNLELLTEVSTLFDLHPLMVEDILNFDHRPKLEEYPKNIFVVAKMLALDGSTGDVTSEQVSFVLGKGYLITFQERPGDVFQPIRERMKNGLGRIRRSGPDYLLYALLDVIVDNYFVVLESSQEKISELERKVADDPGNEDNVAIMRLRRELIRTTNLIMPARELASRMGALQHPLVTKDLGRFIGDLQDHMVYIVETTHLQRELINSLENTYHAMVNLRLGKIMQVLTVISTIFIPLTFLAGIYGMNFKHMPELEEPYGYPILLGVMAMIAVGMFLWLRGRRWM